MTDQLCIRCKRVMDHSDSLSLCPTCDAQDADILAREDRVSFFNAVSLAMKHDRRLFTPDESDDEETTGDDESSLPAAKRYAGVVTAQLAGRSWIECRELGEGRHKFFTIDASGDVRVGSTVEFETDYQYPGFDGTYWWVKNVVVIDAAPAIGSYHLIGDGSVPDDRPLNDAESGLLEHAEHIADGLEDGSIVLIDETGAPVPFVDEELPSDDDTGAVMFLTFEQSEFMTQVCRFEGLIVYLHQTDGIRMALDLEAGGLVTVQRTPVFWVVSAVRGGA
jgi:hypothetical protein